jgi:hypothetical protein
MKTVDVDKPFKLTFEFAIALAVLTIPTLWISKPWTWDLPLYSRAAGTVFLPFAATIVIYCPILFFASVSRDAFRNGSAFRAFFATILGATIYLSLFWYFRDLRSIPWGFGCWTLLNGIYAMVRRKE